MQIKAKKKNWILGSFLRNLEVHAPTDFLILRGPCYEKYQRPNKLNKTKITFDPWPRVKTDYFFFDPDCCKTSYLTTKFRFRPNSSVLDRIIPFQTELFHFWQKFHKCLVTNKNKNKKNKVTSKTPLTTYSRSKTVCVFTAHAHIERLIKNT